MGRDGRCRCGARRPQECGELGAWAQRKEKADCGRQEMQRCSFRHQSFGEASGTASQLPASVGGVPISPSVAPSGKAPAGEVCDEAAVVPDEAAGEVWKGHSWFGAISVGNTPFMLIGQYGPAR